MTEFEFEFPVKILITFLMVGEALRPQLFLPAALNKQMLFCFWLACHEEANSHFAINI